MASELETEKVDFEDWGRALRLVAEGNVKMDFPADTHTSFKVIGEHDSYTVGVDMDTREAGGCMCGDKTYNDVEHCYHEIAVMIAMGFMEMENSSEIRQKIMEDPNLFVRRK